MLSKKASPVSSTRSLQRTSRALFPNSLVAPTSSAVEDSTVDRSCARKHCLSHSLQCLPRLRLLSIPSFQWLASYSSLGSCHSSDAHSRETTRPSAIPPPCLSRISSTKGSCTKYWRSKFLCSCWRSLRTTVSRLPSDSCARSVHFWRKKHPRPTTASLTAFEQCYTRARSVSAFST